MFFFFSFLQKGELLKNFFFQYQTFYKEFEPHDDAVSSVIFIRENRQVWTGSWDKSIRVWEKAP